MSFRILWGVAKMAKSLILDIGAMARAIGTTQEQLLDDMCQTTSGKHQGGSEAEWVNSARDADPGTTSGLQSLWCAASFFVRDANANVF
ncbi:MAG: hypothetical protein JWN49_188 [Parcubacteria group bacterium]|nr:hypothetical protein [Parcubacteria group bacterium]